jgi:hypothetical protein
VHLPLESPLQERKLSGNDSPTEVEQFLEAEPSSPTLHAVGVKQKAHQEKAEITQKLVHLPLESPLQERKLSGNDSPTEVEQFLEAEPSSPTLHAVGVKPGFDGFSLDISRNLETAKVIQIASCQGVGLGREREKEREMKQVAGAQDSSRLGLVNGGGSTCDSSGSLHASFNRFSCQCVAHVLVGLFLHTTPNLQTDTV